MYISSEGVILRQVKTTDGRRMILLFSRKYGKISAGSSINERGRSKAALAMRPFTFGRYELYKSRESYSINSAEAIRSFYRLGEDIDKYMCASYALEFTEKLLPEEQPAPQLFQLLVDFFSLLSERQKKYETLLSAYQLKALALAGAAPELSACVLCGGEPAFFSVPDGGLLCGACRKKMAADTNVSLIFPVNVGTINILKYFLDHPLQSLAGIGLDDEIQKKVRQMLKSYCGYHLDVTGLKSEDFFEPDAMKSRR